MRLAWMSVLVAYWCLAATVAPAAGRDPAGRPSPREQPVAQAGPSEASGAFVPGFQRGTGAGGPANALNTGDERASATLPGGAISGILFGELYHGNFCGRGNRGDRLKPTDPLDAACKRHDACFGRAGRPSCACNWALLRESAFVADRSDLSRELRRRAGIVMQAAYGMACQDP